MAEYEGTHHNRDGSITAALTTGIIGTAGTALGALMNGGGLLGGGTNYATKEDLQKAILLAQKDSEIALLKANAVTRQETIDVFERSQSNLNAFKTEQQAINAQQAVYNSANNAAVSVLNTQVAQLMGLTALHIPSANVCPTPMPQYNSWTAPTT